jgi:hypothetical protein
LNAFAFDLSELQAALGAMSCPWPIALADVRRLFESGLVFNSLEIIAGLQAIPAPRIGRMRFSPFPPADGAYKANLCVPEAFGMAV